MTLTQFTAAVNALGRARSEKLNEEFRSGKRLFGASPHRDFSESAMKNYFERGRTPEQTLKEFQ